mgnify:CR=1 FL=1
MNYVPTKFKTADSIYDKAKADRAVNFIKCLKHTKGKFYGKQFELMEWQEQIIRDLFGIIKPNGYRQFNTAYVEICKKNGKQLALDTPIPTPEGFKTMGELQIGDKVFDERGEVCSVVAKSAVDDTEQAYRITFRDGSSIVAGENHLWNLEYIYGKRKNVVWTTGEIYRRFEKFRKKHIDDRESNRSIVRIRVADALELPEAELPIDPYLYGYWLGNGCANKPDITVRDSDVEEIISLIPYQLHNRYHQTCGGSEILCYKELKKILVPTFRDKVIRPEYLRASKNQRWELLQGLTDSDGCISKIKGQSIYCSTIKQLAESVRELLWSLGIKNAMKEYPSTRYGEPTGETIYVIRFTTFDDQPTSKLHRKISRHRERKKETRSCFHYLADIEPLTEKVKMQCIQVDSNSHCYLAGKSFVPTHNSELAAAVALLLTCADGEKRAEVYGCAADRQQATIVFDVAADMIRQCPPLAKRCKILTANKRIIFNPTNSFYQVLSAEAYSKHGFNISGVIFDELHAQPDRRLYDVMTKGSGFARTQPLYFNITTAGSNLNSICYEVHQKAKDILEGRKIDSTFYPVIYGAEMDDDWTSPEVWAKANPSLGVTIDIEKLEAACNSAKNTPAEESAFRQLNLNQWQTQNERWLSMLKVNACKVDFTEEDLEGRVCYGGLDLSSTTDLTAFVLVFPPTADDDKYYVLPYFWLPEETIDLRTRRDHVPYAKWKQEGIFFTTEGNVVDYDYIEKKIVELGQRYEIRRICYDRWNATQLTQRLELEYGFEMAQFGQGFFSMSSPSKELERLILEKKIAHNGHKVLLWCFDNVCCDIDAAGNIKPSKKKATEKIDGVVALIMGLDAAIKCGGVQERSVYESRGLLFI